MDVGPGSCDGEPIGRLVTAIEERIALLSRCRPVNATEQRVSLLAALARGESLRPRWRYAAAPADLDDAARALEALRGALRGPAELQRLVRSRIDELRLELELVRARGAPQFRALARERFPLPGGRDRARAWALGRSWCAGPPPSEPGPAVRSDDLAHPGSLIRQLQKELTLRGLPPRVLVAPSLQSVAATATDGIYLAPDVPLSLSESRRIALHEVVAHALPRARAKRHPYLLFRISSAEGGAAEEGRALLLEKRDHRLGALRRWQLGLRHVLAHRAAEGADFDDTVRAALAAGAIPGQSIDLAARIHRGGGLCRELCYLPALQRVERELAADPEIEAWLAQGRVSVAAARVLRESGITPNAEAYADCA